MSATFDALNHYEKLKEAGVPEQQAKIQAETFKEFARIQEEKNKEELVTKGDLKDLRYEMQKMRYDLLKWQAGLAVALGAIMAKGFGWLGF